MFLRYIIFSIQVILLHLLWHPTPILCADDYTRCQKSGCRSGNSNSNNNNSNNRLQQRPNYATYQQQQQQQQQQYSPGTTLRRNQNHYASRGFRMYTLVMEWIFVFFFLRFFLYIRVNGCRAIHRRVFAVKNSIVNSFDSACTSIICSMPGMRRLSMRGSGGGSRSRGRGGGSRGGRFSQTDGSLGSLADLVGWDSEDDGGSTNSYGGDSSLQSTSVGGGNSSYFTLSESEATTTHATHATGSTETTLPRKGRVAAAATSAASVTVSNDDDGTSHRHSYTSFTSNEAVTRPTVRRKRTKNRSRLARYYNQRAGNTSGNHSDGSNSSTNSSTSNGSILSQFMDYLSKHSADEKKKKTDIITSSSLAVDDNGVKYGFDRSLLHYDGHKQQHQQQTQQQRRGSVEGVKLRYNPISKNPKNNNNNNNNNGHRGHIAHNGRSVGTGGTIDDQSSFGLTLMLDHLQVSQSQHQKEIPSSSSTVAAAANASVALSMEDSFADASLASFV